MIPGVLFVAGDAYAWMRRVRHHDVLITDPPFTEHVQKNLLAATKGRAVKTVAAGFEPLGGYDWIDPIVQGTKRWALFCCALEQLGDYRLASPATHIRSGIYCKMRATPQFSGDRPGGRCEGIAIFHRGGRKRWSGGGTHAFWRAMPENRKDTMHPTAKPIMLAMQIVSQFSEPGELVFDPFCGTGAFGIACALLGRRFLGVDSNIVHLANAVRRVELYTADRGKWLDKYAQHLVKEGARG